MPYLSKIKCSCYYQNYLINETDNNDLLNCNQTNKKNLKRIKIEIIND